MPARAAFTAETLRLWLSSIAILDQRDVRCRFRWRAANLARPIDDAHLAISSSKDASFRTCGSSHTSMSRYDGRIDTFVACVFLSRQPCVSQSCAFKLLSAKWLPVSLIPVSHRCGCGVSASKVSSADQTRASEQRSSDRGAMPMLKMLSPSAGQGGLPPRPTIRGFPIKNRRNSAG